MCACMCVCMCVCIHKYIYIHTHISLCVCMCLLIDSLIRLFVYWFGYLQAYLCIYSHYVCIYIMCMCITCIYIYICTHVRARSCGWVRPDAWLLDRECWVLRCNYNQCPRLNPLSPEPQVLYSKTIKKQNTCNNILRKHAKPFTPVQKLPSSRTPKP